MTSFTATLKDLYLEVIHVISAHIPLIQGSHMTTPNFRGTKYNLSVRGDPEIALMTTTTRIGGQLRVSCRHVTFKVPLKYLK